MGNVRISWSQFWRGGVFAAYGFNDAAGLDQYQETLENYSKTLAEDASSYWSYHKKGFTWTATLLMRLVHDLRKSGKPVNRILDIGNSFQTLLFESLFQDIQIDTMGFLDSRYMLKRKSVHIRFDLNDSYYKEKWPQVIEEENMILSWCLKSLSIFTLT